MKVYNSSDEWYAGEAPLVFLAGPLRNTENWRDEAINNLTELNINAEIACPRLKEATDDFEYIKQAEWDTAHLRIASATGGILFWLAGETNHNCANPFSQRTNFELAEWLTHYKYRKKLDPDRKLKVAIGVDENYPDRKYIIHRILSDCPEYMIATTLKETCVLLSEMLKL